MHPHRTHTQSMSLNMSIWRRLSVEIETIQVYIYNYICRYMFIYINTYYYYYIHIKMHFLAHAIHACCQTPPNIRPPLSRSNSSTGGCLVCWSTSSWRDQPPLRPHTPCRSMPKSWDLDLCHKPPMTGNGTHTTYKNGHLGDGLWHCFTHIIAIIIIDNITEIHSPMNIVRIM